ncbi:MAG: Na(+)-translocating NADH-quinone reductase subunit A [Desulforhopalus sp.]
MKTIFIKKGLDIPISGKPEQKIRQGNTIRKVALIGDDYIDMKPTMLVNPGDRVTIGQQLFTDKKNEGVIFTSPGCGTINSINRGDRRKFESIVIDIDGEETVTFCDPTTNPEDLKPETIRDLLITSGLWPAFRTRPYGKIPAIDSEPVSLFITAMDTSPLAADPGIIIEEYQSAYQFGLKILRRLITGPVHYCTDSEKLQPYEEVDGLSYWSFQGPHPAGLPSTHIHFIDPVHETKTVWHIGYQDVIDIGHLFMTGQLLTERVVALGGSGVFKPSLVKTRIGASLTELCRRELSLDDLRIISGSVLSGRRSKGNFNYLGRYHNQISVIEDSSGRSILNWFLPGKNRFSVKPIFISAYMKEKLFPMSTALWGGRRAIFPLATYEQVMPLDIIAIYLLKSISIGDTEKSKALGALELIEDDLGLCGFVCPGKNEFGPALREVLTAIELGG